MAAAACSLNTPHNYEIFIECREKLKTKLNEFLTQAA
jgi:hypothetical protein